MPIRIVTAFLSILLLLCSWGVSADNSVYTFNSEADRERFKRFTYELRCPKCQSQNLAGSDAKISQDLKRELHRLINEGKDDEAIIDFMVSRYGEFVLYKPRFKETTYLLWLGPLGLVLLGLAIFGWVLVRKQATQVDDE